MMMLNPVRVTADVIEANEFPEYSERYHVWAVPRTVINEETHFEGALPEDAMLEHIKQALEQQPA